MATVDMGTLLLISWQIGLVILTVIFFAVPCFQQYHEAMENENSMIQH